MNNKTTKIQRQTRTRNRVTATQARPRLSVFRSNKYISAQIVDASGKTIVGISGKKVATKGTPTEKAQQVGVALAKQAMEKKITTVVFDKGRFAYHGQVKALAEGARGGGLQF